MSNNQLNRTKITFLVCIVIIVPILVLGVMKLQGDYYWQKNFVSMQWIFAKTRVEYLMRNMAYWNNSDQNNFVTLETGNKASSVPVLLYHGIMTDPNWTNDGVNTSLEDFKNQMILLKSLGYETISLQDFISFQKEMKPLPAKSFLLTFDDGRKDSYYGADPILRALGYRAVMFVITGRSLVPTAQTNTFHLNETELKKMIASNRWDIESHTQNGHDLERIDAQGDQGHFMSNKLWLKYEGRIENNDEYRQRIENDLAQSKSDIEKSLGTSVVAFAYPFGDYGTASQNYPESRSIVLPIVQKIFPYSFYQMRDSDYFGNYPGQTDMVKRLAVSSEVSPNELVSKFLNSEDKTASDYKDNFFIDKGWMVGWGKRQFQNGLMLTGPTNSEDSSLTFLDGSFLWQDYVFESQVQLMKGKAFALMARYQNGNDYATCDFGEEELSINEHRDGTEYTLAQIPFSSEIFASQGEAGVSVHGQRISCLANGKEVLSSSLNTSLDHGGIGFKTWDSKLFNSELLVKNVDVQGISLASALSFRGAIAEK